MNDDISTEESIIQQRREELQNLRESSWKFPNDFRRNIAAQELHTQYDDCDNEQLEKQETQYKIAGRIVLKRVMGKASFITLQDYSGRVQAYIRQDRIGEEAYKHTQQWDLGDIVGVTGKVFKTKTNELTIQVEAVNMLVKSLRPLPDKYHGLTDTEQRYRKRYLDLMLNQDNADIFRGRSKIITAIRDFFISKQFLEVETPMMHTIAGGALAKPFETFHNALGVKMFLRVAPELFLKRLLVGGFEKVFEINRNFRNEGLSTRHNPEFTMLEFYEAYADYKDFILLIEDLLSKLTIEYCGKDNIIYKKNEISMSKPFAKITHEAAVLQYNKNLSKEDYDSLDKMRDYATTLGIKLDSDWTLGKLQNEVFEKSVEEELLQPTFITQYPADISPLARRNDNDPHIADRFELFIGGAEIANGFSELNDPEEQARVFKMQAAAKEGGDEEAMHYDEDYITALEYGMPPAAGAGIGIDRLVMLLTNSDAIRDVLLFPHLRPKD